MNEQHQQAYLNLIQNLQNCTSGEALELLAANQNLINTGFVETMAKFAKGLLGNSGCNTAESLIPLVSKLTEIHFAFKVVEEKGFSSSTPIASPPPALAYRLPFLLQVLMVTTESDGNAEVVYPLLQVNLDKLDDITALVLHSWATVMLMMAQPDEAQGIASHIVKMSDLIAQFPLGLRADNVEIAIAGYKVALIVYKRETSPHDWGQIQNNLGIAYGERIRGERFENLEEAIACHRAALEVLSYEISPVDWAIANTNLAKTYIDRIKGEQARNVEEAINFSQNALQVYKRELFPKEWAALQHNLGSIYYDKIQKERTQNLEKAIAYYQAALEVRTREEFPEDWAMTQINLGTVYRDRVNGERAENLEKSIACYKAALQVYNREAFPQQWAMAQVNLGSAYTFRSRGERVQNQEDAITCYRAALKVFDREAFPQYWAMTQNNLGIVYWERIQGERTKNLEEAITCYEVALEVCTCEAFPQNWAMIQHNLGIAYHDRIEGEQSQNHEKAIACYLAALEVRTREAFPQYWAMTQHNLGIAYSDRILGRQTEYLGKAIACYLAALEIRTCEAFPTNHAETQFHLGKAYQDARQFAQAHNTFKCAIDTVESLREEIIFGSGMEVDKQKLAEKYNQMYQGIVQVCLELAKDELQYYNQAIEYVERSKTRNLVELILNRDQKTIFPPEVVTQLEQLRDEIAARQYQLQNDQEENPTVIAQHLQKLRSQRQELQDGYLPVGSGFKFDQFQSTLDNHTAVIEWYITDNKILAFIIKLNSLTPFPSSEGGEVTVWQSQPEDLKALIDWVNEYLQDYYQQKDQWQNRLESRLKKLAQILHIEEILHQIPKHCDKLILIPHRYLHLFPIHALPIQESCLLELFPNGVSYAPSCQLLQLSQQRQRADFESVFAIQNPTSDLLFTDLEVNSILPLFSSHQVLPKTQATKTALSQAAPQLMQANYLHFSCHGLFNPNSPLDSCLVLAGANEGEALDFSKCLTLGNLFDRNLDLNQCRLVTLSACETGLIDFTNTSDEYIGLPSGFLYAGSKSVVSSLWTVNDLSTALLMIRFHQNLKAGLTVSVALNQAQVWLRDSTQGDLWKWTQQLNLAEGFQEQIDEYLSWFNVEERPFEKAVYWGAFCAVGC